MYQLIDSAPFIDYTAKGQDGYYRMVLKGSRNKIILEDDKYLWIVRNDNTYDTLKEKEKDVAVFFNKVLQKDCVVEVTQDIEGKYLTPDEKEQFEKERKEKLERERLEEIERHKKVVNYQFKNSRIPMFKGRVYTFENYKCSKENNKAFEIIKNHTDGFLTICGSTGLGKTHLAMANGIMSIKDDEESVLYYQVEELMDELRHSYDKEDSEGNNSFDSKMKKLKECDLLILDDFGTQKNTDWVLSKLDTIIDYRYIYDKSLIITSNLSLKSIGEISERIASRLSSGQVVTLTGNDYRATHKEVKDDTD